MAQQRLGAFTHAPRSVRSRDIDMQHIRLELTLDWQRPKLLGRAVLTLKPFRPIRKVSLDASEMNIEGVGIRSALDKDQSKPLKYDTHGDKLIIHLDREIAAGEQFTLEIGYRVVSPQRGMHFVTPDENEPDQLQMSWTQGEPQYAHYWCPCYDSPNDRLTSEVFVTVPEDYFVLSNGILKSKSQPKEGKRTWHWAQEKDHVTYLISVVAGKFESYEQSWDGIPIVSYVPPGRLADAPRSFEKTPKMMAFFSEKIGYRYPWAKYAQICVDEYSWGGMEHTSATTLNLSTLHDAKADLDVSSENLVAHELVHHWWGDLITCKDWAEIWLNESFATYFATLWKEHDSGWDEAAWARHLEAEAYFGEDKRYRPRLPRIAIRNLTICSIDILIPREGGSCTCFASCWATRNFGRL